MTSLIGGAYITTIDVFREEGVEPVKPYTWSAGLAIRHAYERETGLIPVKDNREKTNDPGVHCFALYPRSYRARMAEIIHAIGAEASRQLDLFRGGPNG